jgi:hypothetical protein
MSDEHGHALLRFEWIVRGLAQDAAVQRTLFPDFAGAGEELALEFDEHHHAIQHHGIALPAEAAERVAALDDLLTAMSAQDRDELWFDDDVLATAPEWAAVRGLARRVLDAMGWSHEPPPAERDVYVGPP